MINRISKLSLVLAVLGTTTWVTPAVATDSGEISEAAENEVPRAERIAREWRSLPREERIAREQARRELRELRGVGWREWKELTRKERVAREWRSLPESERIAREQNGLRPEILDE